jgi:mono/diheme cytochrome c family protein
MDEGFFMMFEKSNRAMPSVGTCRLLLFVVLAAVGAGLVAVWFSGTFSSSDKLYADASDSQQVEEGQHLYGTYCASCHGVALQGQPHWQQRDGTGFLPAPPHDETGHTWHHPDAQLFAVTKRGVAAFAPAGYQSNMQGYGDRLSDGEIWSILAYIKSRWPQAIQRKQAARNGG